MEHPSGINFLPAPIFLVVSLLLLAATGWLCWLGWRRSGFRPANGWLELLRFLLVTLVVVTLSQPEWLRYNLTEQSPTLAVLYDESASMNTRDVIDSSSLRSPPDSRAEAIRPLLSEKIWRGETNTVNESLKVVFEPFSSQLEPADSGTDINSGLSQILDNQSNLRGVVLLSDGDWNVGRSPFEAATQFRLKGVPVFPVGVGSRVPLPDIELMAMDAPTFGVSGKPLRIPFLIRSNLGQDRELNVTLSVDGQSVITKQIIVPAMGQVHQNVSWTPLEIGDFNLQLDLPKDSLDLVEDNNSVAAPISIRQEQLQVLVVETYPRWEYRYLRNALERDPGVEVTCLLFHPQLKKAGGGRTYIKQFPGLNELSQFDVVFLGDVGIGPKQLNLQQVEALKQLISAQASGLVFLPGRYGFQESLSSSSLSDLYPVILDTAQTAGIGSLAPGHFSLTQTGQQSLLTRLADTDQQNIDIWRRLPGFHWYAGIRRAKVGSEILAVHDQDSNTSGRVPLIVTKTYGTGKVLFMGTDSAWRWREGVEDRYHYRFWGQVARWMAYQRQKAQGKSMRLFCSPDRPRVDGEVMMNANILDAFGGFLEEGNVMVEAISPSGKSESIRLQPGQGDARGLFSGTFIPAESGTYRLLASSRETGASIQTDLSVQGVNREQQGRLARFDVLQEIAAITQGRVVPISEVGSLLDYLTDLPDPEPSMHRTRIWAHPAWCGFLIFLMGLFWTGRKIIGAI